MADVDSKKLESKNVQDLTLVVNKLLTDMVGYYRGVIGVHIIQSYIYFVVHSSLTF